VTDSLPTRPGWYSDPYEQGQIRWFDGTMWTAAAVDADTTDPDSLVEQEWDSEAHHDPSEGWQQYWGRPFSDNDVSRFSIRYPNPSVRWMTTNPPSARVFHPVRLLILGFVATLLMAWVDPGQRTWLFLASALLFVAVVISETYLARRRTHERLRPK
jgi:hypothetical protein